MPIPKPILAAKEEGLALLPPLQAAIATLAVVDEDSYLVADAMLGKIQQARKRWSARIGKIIDPLWEALKSGRELKNEVDKPLEALELGVKDAMRTFKLAEQKRIQAALDEEARLRDLAEQKERLEAAAKTQPMKDRLRQAREDLEAKAEEAVEKQSPVLAISSSTRTVRKWRFRDDGSTGEEVSGLPNGFREFVIAAAEQIQQPAGRYRNLPPLYEFLLPNSPHFRKYELNQIETWPGVEGYDDVIISGR